MIRRTSRTLATASASALLLVACGGTSDDASTAGPGAGAGTDAAVQVMAAFYPLEWAAQRVGGDRASVTSLTPPGAEAHDVELSPQDVAAVSEADLVVYLSGFQSAVDDAVGAEAGASWDAAQAADLSLTTEDDHTDEDHADEDAVDPHFWLDPLRLAAVGDALADELTDVDPAGAQTYADGAASLREDLEALDAEMTESLASCQITTLVTSHDAFGYLADRYGFDVVGVSGLSPSNEPSPEQLAQVSDLVAERGVSTVYTEVLVDPAVAETVAAEAGAQTAVLDPLEGLTEESAGGDYLEVMRANLSTLARGQGCA